MPAATLREILRMNYTKPSTSSQCAPSVSTRPAVKLHIVKGTSQPLDIFEQVGLSLPNELNQSSSKTIIPEKSPAHLKAIEAVEQLRAKKINATKLKNLYEDTYTNWKDMKSRCGKVDVKTGTSPIELHPYFIKFADFLSIMGPRPEPTWSLDRIDPTGPYAPENVRWASETTQARNRTNTVYLEYQGARRPLTEWAEIRGEAPDTYRARKRLGWTDEEVIEGRRRPSYSAYSTLNPERPRDPFSHTPWPINFRGHMEHEFQRFKHINEHRLAFMKRYAQECMNDISTKAEYISWPEDYTPTQDEASKAEELDQEYKFWRSLFDDACRKLCDVHSPRLYNRLHLPDWVEASLAKHR